MIRPGTAFLMTVLAFGPALAQSPPAKPAAPPAGQPAQVPAQAPAQAPAPAGAAAAAKGPQQPLQATGGILPGKLNPTQKEVLQAVSKYFSTIRTMNGEFVQFGPDGNRTEGEFYLSKPGKIHFQYAKPLQLEVTANGSDVVILDRKKRTQDLYPLSKTPLKYLLADQIDLSTEPSVTKVAVDPDMVTITLEQSTVFGDGKLALIFDRKTSELLQWTVTDAQGYETAVTIYNTSINVVVDEKLFYIDPLFNTHK